MKKTYTKSTNTNKNEKLEATLKKLEDGVRIFQNSEEYRNYLKAKRKLKNKNVCALSTGLKWRIVCQLMAKEFDILEIADIVFAQHEKQEWIYCEDALDLKELIEDDTGKYASCICEIYGQERFIDISDLKQLPARLVQTIARYL